MTSNIAVKNLSQCKLINMINCDPNFTIDKVNNTEQSVKYYIKHNHSKTYKTGLVRLKTVKFIFNSSLFTEHLVVAGALQSILLIR